MFNIIIWLSTTDFLIIFYYLRELSKTWFVKWKILKGTLQPMRIILKLSKRRQLKLVIHVSLNNYLIYKLQIEYDEIGYNLVLNYFIKNCLILWLGMQRSPQSFFTHFLATTALFLSKSVFTSFCKFI